MIIEIQPKKKAMLAMGLCQTKIMGRDQETEEEKGVSIMRLW
jgi:hypothetical protein